MNDIKILLNYNFNPADLDFSSDKFEDLFNFKRRDSCFAFVYEDDGDIYAIRDHFGQIPLYYRADAKIRFSTSLISLLDSECHVNFKGLKHFLSFGTSRIIPPFDEIKVVPSGSVIKINKKTKKVKLLYQYLPMAKHYKFKRFNDHVDKFEELFSEAIQRTIKNKEVGLLLSGGIDSGLTGYYLKKQGIRINAYSSAPHGRTSSEIKFSKINGKIIKPENHFISYLEKEDFLFSFENLFSFYKTINGIDTSLGVVKLYQDFPIENEKQVYYAQNSDTANCSVSSQYVAYFSKFIFYPCRKFLHRYLSQKDCLRNYLNFVSKGLINKNEEFEKRFPKKDFSDIERLSLAGILIVHSQSDSEVVTDPLIHQNILVSNPFFDVDVVEFFLGIPLRYRLAFQKKSPTKIVIEKSAPKKLAARFFPEEVYKRKKGFNVPLGKLPDNFFDILPLKIDDIIVDNLHEDQKFSLKVLLEWCRKFNIKEL